MYGREWPVAASTPRLADRAGPVEWPEGGVLAWHQCVCLQAVCSRLRADSSHPVREVETGNIQKEGLRGSQGEARGKRYR